MVGKPCNEQTAPCALGQHWTDPWARRYCCLQTPHCPWLCVSGKVLRNVAMHPTALLKAPALGLSKQQANQAAQEVTYDASGAVGLDALVTPLNGLYETVIGVVAEALRQANTGEVGAELGHVALHLETRAVFVRLWLVCCC